MASLCCWARATTGWRWASASRARSSRRPTSHTAFSNGSGCRRSSGCDSDNIAQARYIVCGYVFDFSVTVRASINRKGFVPPPSLVALERLFLFLAKIQTRALSALKRSHFRFSVRSEHGNEGGKRFAIDGRLLEAWQSARLTFSIELEDVVAEDVLQQVLVRRIIDIRTVLN